MASVDEALGVGGSQLNPPLELGTETLSQRQTITFQKYMRFVLPLDGFVFWINADLIATSDLPNLPKSSGAGPNSVDVLGSFHYATARNQVEDQTIGVNRVLFTTSERIQEFNQLQPGCIFIASFDGIRFAFSSRGNLYQAATIYHYQGDAIYPAMESQIIDSLEDFDTTDVVVSNSLPIWLAMPAAFKVYNPTWDVPMFPSFAVPENIEPPYCSVHIPPDSTETMQSAPMFDATFGHHQWCKDRVRLTFYGLRNDAALDFQDMFIRYTLDHDGLIGIMNMPVMRDEKRIQAELGILAMKKTFEVDVNYWQNRARDIARKLILTVIPNYYFNQL